MACSASRTLAASSSGKMAVIGRGSPNILGTEEGPAAGEEIVEEVPKGREAENIGAEGAEGREM